MKKFIAPCTEHYGCNPNNLQIYSSDAGKVDFLKCKSCDIIWRDTLSCPEERSCNEEYFAKKGYVEKRNHRMKKSDLLLSIMERFVSQGRLLEIGPGAGETLQAAKERGWEVEGLDISKYVIDINAEFGFKVFEGSLDKIPRDISRKTYDAVILKHVLEHYKNPFEALSASRTLLKTGGAIMIIVPNSDYRRADRLREKPKFYRHEDCGIEHFVYFNNASLKRALESCGFEQVNIGFPFFLGKGDSFGQIINRGFRRIFPFFGYEQEIFTIAKKR